MIPIHYYTNNKDCIVSKILLISRIDKTNWYNDITPYINKNLLFLYMRIKDTLLYDNTIKNTHITEEYLNNNTILEIHTLNLKNLPPRLISREDILQIMYKDWMKQL